MAAGAYGLGMTVVGDSGISLWWGIGIGVVYSVVLGSADGHPDAAPARRLPGDRDDRRRRDHAPRRPIGEVQGGRSAAPTASTTSPATFQPARRRHRDSSRPSSYGFWAFKFSGQRPVGADRRLVAGRHLRRPRVRPDESPWGRVLKAIREDEDAVRSLGKNVYSYKMQSLILGGVIGTFGGHDLGARHRQRAARQLQPRPDVLRADRRSCSAASPRSRARSSGRCCSGRCTPSSTACCARSLRDGPVRIGDFTLIQSTQVGQVVFVFIGRDADAADGVPTAGSVRQPQGDGVRWTMTAPPRAALRDRARPPSGARRRAAPSRAVHKPDPILDGRGVRAQLRRHHGRRRRARRGPARLDHGPDRSQRRRQDDVLQPADRVRQARRRRVVVRRRVDGAASRRTRWRHDGHGAHVPAHQEPDQAGGDREHEARRHRPAWREVVERLCSRRCGGRRRPRSRRAPTSCCQRFKLDHMRDEYAGRCRAVSASCSRWRGR